MPTDLPERKEEPQQNNAIEITKLIVGGTIFCFVSYLVYSFLLNYIGK